MTVQIVRPDWLDPTHGRPALEAFGHGLHNLGLEHRMVTIDRARPSRRTAMVCCGVEKTRFPQRTPFGELQRDQRRLGGPLIILERGFVHRDRHVLVSFDDLNGRGRFPHDFTAPADRWAKLGVELRPWQDSGEDILIVGQVPWDTSCQHIDLGAWIEEAAKAMRTRCPKRRLVFRPHPLQPHAIQPPRGLIIDRGRLDRALSRAGLVVTFSSTVGVDALIAGRPLIAFDRTSMADRLGQQVPGAGFERVIRNVDRRPWAHWLASCQWSLEELAAGAAWRHLFGDVA